MAKKNSKSSKSEELNIYQYKTKIVFEVDVFVRASDRERAYQILKNDFGATLTNVHSSNSSDSVDEEGVVDWNYDVHPINKTHKLINTRKNA